MKMRFLEGNKWWDCGNRVDSLLVVGAKSELRLATQTPPKNHRQGGPVFSYIKYPSCKHIMVPLLWISLFSYGNAQYPDP